MQQHVITSVFQLDSYYIYDGVNFRTKWDEGALPEELQSCVSANECAAVEDFCIVNQSTLLVYTLYNPAPSVSFRTLKEVDLSKNSIVSSIEYDGYYIESMTAAQQKLPVYLNSPIQAYTYQNSSLQALNPYSGFDEIEAPYNGFNRIWAFDESHVYLVGDDGYFAVYDGGN